MADATQVTPRTLHIIRAALFAGVAIFGLVVWRVLPGRPFSVIEPGAERILIGAFYALCAFAIVGTVLLRSASQRAATFSARASITIAAWALTEGAAFFGGILWILTDRPAPFLVGALLFLIAGTAVPVPEPGETSAAGP